MTGSEHWFYQLEGGTLEAALPPLLEKILSRGWRALIRSPDPKALDALDRHLWTHRPDSFLPHGLCREPRAANQPILLTDGADNENAAQIVILIHGAEPADLSGVERCVTMFDGTDEKLLAQVRLRWKTAKTDGATVSYWRQDTNGHWAKQD